VQTQSVWRREDVSAHPRSIGRAKLDECALPWAQELAKKCEAQVTLLRVIKGSKGYKRATDYQPPLPGSQQSVATQALGKEEKTAEDYLTIVALRLQGEGVKAQAQVRLGQTAQAIAHYAEHDSCDLIIMASRGRRGFGRWIRGSIADGVSKATCKPVMIVRGPGWCARCVVRQDPSAIMSGC